MFESVRKRFGLTQRKISRCLGMARSTLRYKRKPDDDLLIVSEMKAIIEEHPNYGCQMIGLKLRQTRKINHKRVERLYAENKLQLKNRRPRKKYLVPKRAAHRLSETPEKWIAIDFVIDSVGFKRPLKMLTAVDPVTKEVPLIAPAFSMNGEEVARQLDKVVELNGPFRYLQTDNGPEFRSHEVEKWCKKNNVQHVFSRPGKPTDNCFIESFNRILRNECLNLYYFSDLSSARKIIENWRRDYNVCRPQKGLKGLTPNQYKNKLLGRKPNLNSGRI